MKKSFAIIIISIMLFSLAGFVFAQGRELEIEYPEIAGEQPEETTTPVTEYFKYIFNFLIWVSGIIALVVLVSSGMNYLTSTGNPEAMNEAKSKIGAALLGILILFGSYLVLITINPDLIVFRLPRLRPIMSELPAGVLVCQEKVETESGEDAILKAWDLVLEYKLLSPSEEREKEIKKELDAILDKVALECYTISGSGDIREDFDNKIKFVYFIPSITLGADGSFELIVEYGAIIYEDRGFKGLSKVLASNLTNPGGSADAYVEEATPLKPSSIKPFALIYRPEENSEVILYQEYGQNKGVDLEPVRLKITSGCPSEWWCGFNLSWPPKSMKIEGDLLVVLCKDKIDVGHCETFFSEVENNLEEYDNIIKWGDCKGYEGEIGREIKDWDVTIRQCAEAATTTLMIISAKPY